MPDNTRIPYPAPPKIDMFLDHFALFLYDAVTAHPLSTFTVHTPRIGPLKDFSDITHSSYPDL